MDDINGIEREYLEVETSQFRQRIESVRDQAESLVTQLRTPDSDDTLISRAELDALVQRIRITCSLLLMRVDDLLNAPQGPTRSSIAFSMQSALTSLLSEVEALEDRLRELRAEVATNRPGAPAAPPSIKVAGSPVLD